jgi:hypothetical protein
VKHYDFWKFIGVVLFESGDAFIERFWRCFDEQAKFFVS